MASYMQDTAQALVTQLGLQRHPEGGSYFETFDLRAAPDSIFRVLC